MNNVGRNTVAVFSCVSGKENRSEVLQRQKRELFQDDSRSRFDGQPLNFKDIVSDVCNAHMDDVSFLVYSKANGNFDHEYKLQILLDTYFIYEIEVEAAELNDVLDVFQDEARLLSSKYKSAMDEFKQLLAPFKRVIFRENTSESKNDTLIPDLRHYGLLIPIRLENKWTLIWVKFTKFRSLFEMYQLSSSIGKSDKISRFSQELIKKLVAYLLGVEDTESLVYNFTFVQTNRERNPQLDAVLIRDMIRIIGGYQEVGFNVTVDFSYHAIHQYDELTSKPRTRTLPFMSLEDIKEMNGKKSKKRQPEILPTPPQTQESKRKTIDSKVKSNPSTTLSSTKRGKNSSNDREHKTKGKSASSETGTNKGSSGTSSAASSSSSSGPMKVVVTLDNLESVKNTLPYDAAKMNELVSLYTRIYDSVEASLLDKWSRVNFFSKNFPMEYQEPPFSIYGPSQIEYEILKSGGIIATNTLKEKIKKYDVTLNTKTMRYLTSSRRWINQRFKLDPKLNQVFYTRDEALIIPDYRDIPYIVMATHLAYNCLGPDETFDITHQNWYISRKMVSFVIEHCEKCHGKKNA